MKKMKKTKKTKKNKEKIAIFGSLLGFILIIIAISIEISLTENSGSGITPASLGLFISGGIIITGSFLFIIYNRIYRK